MPASASSTKSFTYDTTVRDRLISYNGEDISYNSYGYVSNYEGKNYSWFRGKLQSISRGNPRLTMGDYEFCGFTYNAYGQRTKKMYVFDSLTEVWGSPHPTYNTEYFYDNSGRLMRELCTETYKGSTTIHTHHLIYLYDETGVIGVMYAYDSAALQPYYYHRNLQGDVLAILNTSGTKVAEYTYDAYGNCTVKSYTDYNLAYYNPIRYRGYYYDRETKLYYLNSRYYNSEWRRFISHDNAEYLEPESINGLNLYAYCGNDPVNYADPTGHFVIEAAMLWFAIGIGAAIGAGIGLGATVVQDLDNGKLFDGDITLSSYFGNTFGGVIAGAGIGLCSVLGAGLGVALSTETALTIGGTAISGWAALTIGASGAFISGGLGYAVRTGISKQEKFEWSNMFIEAGANAISGMLTFTGAVVGGITGVNVPGAKFSFKKFALYHIGATYFGVYPTKFILAYIKKKLKERY